ncbi:energy transducer TonB [Endozoicomonas sp. SM1973]|uniref:Protein TonB n=1 Tax=Spartinivicinus marinus TaxID=2994442 RepID=A0A853ICS3_9GAMM|nr:energy transducer TonB [Spartinivicinus marinus]MCX4026337.1 TonB family protein [Spartinivicinus marinus]NYZ67317.1 energy transducer TonB [Spartinivicinus marinus]
MSRLLLLFISVSVLLHGWLWLFLQQQPEVTPKAMAALSSPLKLQHVTFKQRVVEPTQAKPVEEKQLEPKQEVAKVEPKPTPKPVTKKKPAKKIVKKKPVKPKPKIAKVVKPKPVKKPPVKKVVKAKPKPKTPKPVVAKKTEKPIKKPEKQTQVASATPVVAKKSLGSSHKNAQAKPRCSQTELNYPSRAKRRNQQGEVLVKVELDERGGKESISIQKSSGYPVLDREALKMVKRTQCSPMLLAGKPVESTVIQSVVFKLN